MNKKQSPLGQTTIYVETYSPDLLFPIPRKMARDKINVPNTFLFQGFDIWNGYEISWLNLKGKPQIALAEFSFPCNSPNVVESKSFKLYLNSFNQSQFESFEEVQQIIQKDLSESAEATIEVRLFPALALHTQSLQDFPGFCLDSLDIETNTYEVDKNLLTTSSENVEETLYTDLLKSNCLATGQPDWGSVLVRYTGPKIDREGLLKYFISYRRHSGFAEHCVEQIYFDILTECKPEKLSVYGRYTRRGGLDINPFRSNFETEISNLRQPRQ